MKAYQRLLATHRNQIIAYSIGIFFIILLAAIFYSFVKLIIIAVMFIIVNSLLRFYKRIFTGIPLELEVTILATVITSSLYGVWAGFAIAVLTSVVADFFNQFISPLSLINYVIYALIPLVAMFITPSAIPGAGMIIVIVANIVIFFSFLFMGYDSIKNLIFSITNIIFNYFLFAYLAAPLIRLIQ